MADYIKRRDFMSGAAIAASGAVAGGTGIASAAKKETSSGKILNRNENMEYRRCGKTGLMVSAVCLGGHWKRIDKMVPGVFETKSWLSAKLDDPGFKKNRYDVVSKCIDVGINYIDACTKEEVYAYANATRGRRDKMYLGYSWYQREPRRPEYRTVPKLMESLEDGLKMAGLDYVDIWRVTLPATDLPDVAELKRVEESTMGALEKARKEGKVRFTGVSTHNRPWLKHLIETYPDQMQVACTPYTADSKEIPGDSVFKAIRRYDVGVFGIKPFADTALFKGDSTPDSPHREEDDRNARLAIRYILHNPSITAPIPGMINVHQVENAAKAIMERRQLDAKEQADLKEATDRMWANLRPGYNWLKDWKEV